MTRNEVTWSLVILIVGAFFVAWAALWADQLRRQRNSAPAEQNRQIDTTHESVQLDPDTIAPRWRLPAYDRASRQPMPESLAHLQFAADAVRCPVSSRSAIMTSCIVERYVKMRDKALSARARYEALVGLERAYWAALAREGLTQRVEHIPTGGSR